MRAILIGCLILVQSNLAIAGGREKSGGSGDVSGGGGKVVNKQGEQFSADWWVKVPGRHGELDREIVEMVIELAKLAERYGADMEYFVKEKVLGGTEYRIVESSADFPGESSEQNLKDLPEDHQYHEVAYTDGDRTYFVKGFLDSDAPVLEKARQVIHERLHDHAPEAKEETIAAFTNGIATAYQIREKQRAALLEKMDDWERIFVKGERSLWYHYSDAEIIAFEIEQDQLNYLHDMLRAIPRLNLKHSYFGKWSIARDWKIDNLAGGLVHREAEVDQSWVGVGSVLPKGSEAYRSLILDATCMKSWNNSFGQCDFRQSVAFGSQIYGGEISIQNSIIDGSTVSLPQFVGAKPCRKRDRVEERVRGFIEDSLVRNSQILGLDFAEEGNESCYDSRKAGPKRVGESALKRIRSGLSLVGTDFDQVEVAYLYGVFAQASSSAHKVDLRRVSKFSIGRESRVENVKSSSEDLDVGIDLHLESELLHINLDCSLDDCKNKKKERRSSVDIELREKSILRGNFGHPGMFKSKALTLTVDNRQSHLIIKEGLNLRLNVDSEGSFFRIGRRLKLRSLNHFKRAVFSFY